jgi:hypothetical protein
MHAPRALVALVSACALSTLAPTCAAEYTKKNTSNVPGFKLLPGVPSVPTPVSVAPDQNWVGIDGAWNTFTVRVGSESTRAMVFASTSSQQTWIVNRDACVIKETNSFDANCEMSRGFLFNTSESDTWQEEGFYGLWVGRPLGMYGNGFYGFDTVDLGLEGEEGPSVENTTIGTFVTPNFWLGHIGLHSKQTNFSQELPSVPSYMTRLFEEGNIPSVSFGYTVGSQYRMFPPSCVDTLTDLTGGATYLASLTLGGYDSSRFIPNDVSFVFAPDTDRDLVVNIAGITTTTSTTPGIDLLAASNLTMLIDSTVAELWLPVSVCEAFEKAFGLVYDKATDLYLVDDALHKTLLELNPSITFTLGQPFTTSDTVQITLPYAAFDLQARPPYRTLNETTRYFPIRRGKDYTQWVLGRTFLQEAYLSVDWERERFSVHPVDWTYGAQPVLVPIVSPSYGEVVLSKGAGLSTGVIAGIAVGSVLVVGLLISVVVWWFWRRRRNAAKARSEAEAAAAARKGSPNGTDEPPLTPPITNVFPKAELPGNSHMHSHRHPHGVSEKEVYTLHEADNTERPVYEMMGDVPATPEAGGRQLSEKESMMVREKIVNGVDPNGTSEPPPRPNSAPRPAPLLTMGNIAMVDTRLPANVSPITPRTPQGGARLEGGDAFFQPPPYTAARGRGLAVEEALCSPISPMHAPLLAEERRRFSYES